MGVVFQVSVVAHGPLEFILIIRRMDDETEKMQIKKRLHLVFFFSFFFHQALLKRVWFLMLQYAVNLVHTKQIILI